MTKKYFKHKILGFIVLLMLLLPAGLKSQSNQRNTASADKMAQLFNLIGRLYVDSVNMDKLTEEIIRKTLQTLDPHSVYIPKDEVRAMNEQLEGSFDGIGVSFNILNDTILILSTVQGGPSDKLGISGGDRIITINGENVAGTGINNNGVYSRLRGARGTEVNVGIHRRGHSELLMFRIVRDRIPTYSIDAAYKVTNDIGYIKLSRFSATSKREFDAALLKLKEEGITDLILDLTGNGGGYMDVAVLLANEFLERNQLIVYIEGENSPRRDYSANSRGEFLQGNLVIMIDEASASASEIVAGAIQDWDRGVIVGRRSFGKGLVQTQRMFSDSSMLRLTVARYHTPTGRAIQKPYNTNDDEYSRGQRTTTTRLQTGELTGQTTNATADSQIFQTLVENRTVYGGGGITPDIFVPIDTSHNSPYYRQLIGLGIFNRFTLNYIDRNRQQLIRQYSTFEQFDQHFTVTEEILNELQDFAEKEGLAKDTEMFTLSQEYLKLWLKGYFVRDLWDMAALYKVVNRGNPIFLKAVEVLSNSKTEN